jgi:hypothetical protein
MSVQTVALTSVRRGDGVWLVLGVPVVLLGLRRRRVVVLSLLLLGTVGCGARTVSGAVEGAQTYTLIVTGTGTNLAGVVVTHAAQVVLVVE